MQIGGDEVRRLSHLDQTFHGLQRLLKRERELDQLETEFERQSLQWQSQREAYRNEIERLTMELGERQRIFAFIPSAAAEQ